MKFLSFPTVFTLLALAAYAQPAARVMTYNIHHGEGMDGKVDLDRIVSVIQSEQPDIVCLQEVDVNLERSGGADMPAYLAKKLNMQVIFGPNLGAFGKGYGNATLTRFETIGHENIPLPREEGGEQRGCLKTLLKVGQQPLAILNTHLTLEPQMRKEQAAAILDQVKEEPAVLAGDLNETSEGPAVQLLLGRLVDTFPGGKDLAQATSPGGEPLRIDYILASKELRVLASHVVSHEQAQAASDHLPYVVELSLGPPPETAADRGVYDVEDERVEEAIAEGILEQPSNR